MSFKKGDLVICVDDSPGGSTLSSCRLYEVDGQGFKPGTINLVGVDSGIGFYERRFVLVQPANEQGASHTPVRAE